MSDQWNATMEHDYDGIQVADNPLPGWWIFIFFLTIGFGVLYVAYSQADLPERSVYAHYDQAVADNLRLQFGDMGELELSGQTIAQYMNDEKVKIGEIVFKTHCISCHGVNAQGMVGPNLTDDYWKNVRNLEDLGLVIRNGAAAQSMPAWRDRLHPNELVLVAAYVASLRGTDVPGKGPEGLEIPPWDSASAEPTGDTADDTPENGEPASGETENPE